MTIFCFFRTKNILNQIKNARIFQTDIQCENKNQQKHKIKITVCSFHNTKNKHDYYRGKDRIKTSSKYLKILVTKIINYEKEIIPLTSKENKSYCKQQVCYIHQKEFSTNNEDKKNKVGDHCHYTDRYRGAAHNICNQRYKTSKGIPIVFHNGSKYDYHFVIKELAEECEGQFECLGENTEKYITFPVPISKK